MKCFRYVFLCALFLFFNKIDAQSFDEIAKKYSNEMAVMKTYNREIKFSMQKNLPVATSSEDVEMLILQDRANGIYNSYSVYHSSYNELKDIDAYTKVPDGSKYKKIKVTDMKTKDADRQSIFYDDSKETSFFFPALTTGAIAGVSTKEFHKDIHVLGPFYFASYIPILNAQYTVSFPSSMEIKYVVKNDAESIIKVVEDNSGKQRSITFTASDIKVKHRFGDAPSSAYYQPHVIIYVASYTDNDDKKINVFDTKENFYKWNYSFLKNLNNEQSEIIKHLADSLTQNITSPKLKAKAIYQWVQENIKYVAFENGLEGFVPRQAKDVCTKRYGDCKDMSSLTTALLKAVGLEAYYTWIGTRDIPYDYDDVALPLTDNHMISTVKIGDEWIFLDATDPNCAFGMPTKSIQTKQALLAVDENNFKIIRVPTMKPEQTTLIDSTFIKITDNGIAGNMSVSYDGYWGNDAYNTLLYKDPKDVREYVKYRMSKASNKFILGEYSINDKEKLEKKLNIKATFEVPAYGKKVGDEIYINLNLEKLFFDSNIDTAKRKVAQEKDFKYIIQQTTVLELPQGYKATYVPANAIIDKGDYSFEIKYQQENNKIFATQKIINNSLWLDPKDFVTWNSALKDLNASYKEQVVLQKK